MFHTDYKKRIVYILQKGTQRNRIKNIKGAEPKTKTGKMRFRQGRIAYGVQYTQTLINLIKGRTKIRGSDGRYWKTEHCDIGTTPFRIPFGKAKKIKVMGRIKHKPTKHKYQGYNKLDWSKTQDNVRRRR